MKLKMFYVFSFFEADVDKYHPILIFNDYLCAIVFINNL